MRNVRIDRRHVCDPLISAVVLALSFVVLLSVRPIVVHVNGVYKRTAVDLINAREYITDNAFYGQLL